MRVGKKTVSSFRLGSFFNTTFWCCTWITANASASHAFIKRPSVHSFPSDSEVLAHPTHFTKCPAALWRSQVHEARRTTSFAESRDAMHRTADILYPLYTLRIGTKFRVVDRAQTLWIQTRTENKLPCQEYRHKCGVVLWNNHELWQPFSRWSLSRFIFYDHRYRFYHAANLGTELSLFSLQKNTHSAEMGMNGGSLFTYWIHLALLSRICSYMKPCHLNKVIHRN